MRHNGLGRKNHASEGGVDCRQYVSRIVNSGDKVVNEAFISIHQSLLGINDVDVPVQREDL